MTPAETGHQEGMLAPSERRAAILADAARRLDRLARRVDHDWPTLRYRYTRHPHAVAFGQGPPPPGFTLDATSARAQSIGEAAMAYASAAARQHALPFWTYADERRAARRERNGWQTAARLGPMIDWHQHRGQDAGARIRTWEARTRIWTASAEIHAARRRNREVRAAA